MGVRGVLDFLVGRKGQRVLEDLRVDWTEPLIYTSLCQAS